MDYIGIALAFLGASLTTGLCCSGSALGVGMVGRAGAGVLTIDPSKFSRILILLILPGTQGLYGLVVWFLALIKLGFFAGALVPLTAMQGLRFMAACLPMGLGGLMFGWAQGHLCSSGLSIVSKRPNDLSKSIILAIMVEFYSILAFRSTFLMINALNF